MVKLFNLAASALSAGLMAPAWSLDDLLLYSDIGCAKGGIEQSYAQVSGGTMKIGAGQTVPVTCTEFRRGTDAIELNLSADLAIGGYYDFVVKFPDWSQKDVKAYKDVRFYAKNLLSTPAHLAVRWENGTYQASTRRALTLPAGGDWTEIVIPNADFGEFTQTGLMNGFAFSQPGDVKGSRLHVLIDDMRITDGTGQGSLELPAAPGGKIPAGWGPNFLVGTYDSYEAEATIAQLAGKVDYRYQYLTEGWKGYSQGKFIENFVAAGKKIGVKTSFTWYQLGKAGEGGAAVKANLNSSAFMKAYFDDYDLALTQLAASAAQAPILVIEPDMYGFLLQGNLVPDFDAVQMAVDMTQANALSGQTWANTLKGYCEYMVQRAKTKVPGVLAGHLINSWSTLIPGEIGQGTMDAHLTAAASVARFVTSLGDKGKGDLLFVEKSDRDAGTKGAKWSWGDAEYQKYFAWVKTLSARSDLRICGWQISEGNSQSIAANKDDAVERFRDKTAEWANAGFIGILFGPGMAGQADYGNDGGFFLKTMGDYRAKPFALSDASSALFGSGMKPFSSRHGRQLMLSRDAQGRLRLQERDRTHASGLFKAYPSLILGRDL